MKNKILILFSLLILFSTNVVNAENCSTNGFTVLTINGIFTDENGARNNSYDLKRKLASLNLPEPLTVNYVYNPTHLGGAGDVVDLVRQGLFDPKQDYDLVEMLNEASQKVKTQKLLLVGHSQGNFYANNFYDKVVDKEGGVPASSIGVYSVATPDKRVAGDGKYLTSDSDVVIAAFAGRLKNIMNPNTHIDFTNEDDSRGHDFSKIYLKYKSKEIVNNIKDSLSKLNSNDIQKQDELCISPTKVSLGHKIAGVSLVVGDSVVNSGIKVTSFAYNTITSSMKAVATTMAKIARSGLALVGLAGDQVIEEPASIVSLPELNTTETIKTNENINNTNEVLQEENNNIKVTTEDTSIVTNSKEEVSIPPILLPQTTNTVSTNTNVHPSGGGGGTNTEIEDTTENPKEDPIVEDKEEAPPETPTPDTTAPVITLVGDNFVAIKLNGVYTESGAIAKDNIDGDVEITTTGMVDTSKLGEYVITYNATDKAGNTSSLSRTIKVSTYVYVPKYSFGRNNGDGNDWQVWSFNGSNIYDWTDMYVGNYLHEQFKIQTYGKGTYYCSLCLQRGVFSHDPQKGFESSDLAQSSLEYNPQNDTYDRTYEVSIQWDATGYTYTIYRDGAVYKTGYTNITNLTKNSYVGWNGGTNNFKTFPSGNWYGVPTPSPAGRAGGNDMMIKPCPIYKEFVNDSPNLSVPSSGLYVGTGINTNFGRDKVTKFDFKVIYTNKNNIAPQKIEVNVINKTTGDILSPVLMQKVQTSTSQFDDGDFSNGEYFVVDDLYYDTGSYEYYFTAQGDDGKSLRFPETENLNLSVIPSTYKYLSKYSFGVDDSGRDWQVWSFNGSNIYDWKDTYKGGYLHEQFKIQTYGLGISYCSLCLQRGVFNHDPQKGFETSDLTFSPLENNPQNDQYNRIYDVSMQWDATGYTYTIYRDNAIYKTGHVNISDMNNNFWVGWNSASNNFKTFPSGNWIGVPKSSPGNKTGGTDMILRPYPIYDITVVQESEPTPPPVLSSSKEITSFSFDSLNPKVTGSVDSNNFTISLTVPYGTSISNIVPLIVISDKAKINPGHLSPQDFTNPVTYIVEAEDGSKQSYIVSVTVAPNPNPDPPVVIEDVAPSISSYTLNGLNSNITINPLINNLSMVFHANKNVNWMTIKIEKESDSSVYKMFQSGNSCVDGTNICTKVWTGLLSSGGLLQNGNYKIRVHIKDEKGREYEEYMPSVITVSM